jgi:hypothetical protein
MAALEADTDTRGGDLRCPQERIVSQLVSSTWVSVRLASGSRLHQKRLSMGRPTPSEEARDDFSL